MTGEAAELHEIAARLAAIEGHLAVMTDKLNKAEEALASFRERGGFLAKLLGPPT